METERVLLIDDERDAIEVLEWVLTEQGCEVRAVTSGHDALVAAREFKPTLVVTDYFLCGDLNGLEIVQVLRNQEPRLRAVLMTGMLLSDIQPELEAVGDVAVVRKPFESAQILAHLRPGKGP